MILKYDEDEDDDGDGDDAGADDGEDDGGDGDDDEDGLVPRQQRSLESGRRQTFPFPSYLLF